VIKFVVNFDVILDYPFENQKTIHLQFDEWDLIPIEATEEDLIDLDKNISKHNLRRTVLNLAPNEQIWKLGLLITRRD